MFPLALSPFNTNVYSVQTAQGEHVGNLKRVGAVWKFEAIGTDESNDVIPGGGPLTQYHNTVLQEPDAALLNAALQTALLATKTD